MKQVSTNGNKLLVEMSAVEYKACSRFIEHAGDIKRLFDKLDADLAGL